VKFTRSQIDHLLRALHHYDWTRGREMSSTDIKNHQQVFAALTDYLSRLKGGK